MEFKKLMKLCEDAMQGNNQNQQQDNQNQQIPQVDVVGKAKALASTMVSGVSGIQGISLTDASAIISQAAALAVNTLKTKLK